MSRRPARGPPTAPDGFEGAHRRRPQAIPDHAVGRATSAPSLIPAADRAAGMARLQADLASGTWQQRCGHLLALGELDLGSRLILAG